MGQPVIPPTETKRRPGGPETPTPALFRLEDRTIILTGGCGGIGITVASAIVESGGDVLPILNEPFEVESRRAIARGRWNAHSELKTMAAKLRTLANQHKCEATYHQCNLVDERATQQVFAEVCTTLRNPIRGLVACVGQSDTGAAITYAPSTFRRILDTNITTTFIAAQACANAMLDSQSSGSMVLIASMSGHVVNKGADSSAYNTAKSGVLQLGRNLAAEWGARKDMPLIRVNTLSPGYIKTAATSEALKTPGIEELWGSQNMLNRMSYPDEFRGPIVFLLSDGSSYMTGADLRVDGGHCAW